MSLASAKIYSDLRSEQIGAISFVPSLRAFFHHKAHRDDIEDLIQEVLIRMHGRGGDNIDNYEGYLFRVARNVLRDRYRRDHVRCRSEHCELLEQDHPSDDLSPERILFGREQLNSALVAMNELPERSRRILVLLRWEGLSYNEVADLLDISVSAVQKHVTRSMRHLMIRLLESHGPHFEGEDDRRRGGDCGVPLVRPDQISGGDRGRSACC